MSDTIIEGQAKTIKPAIGFDPNADRPVDGRPSAMLPRPVDTFGFPAFSRGIDEYLVAMKAGLDGVAKATPPFAAAYAYAHMSFMPDANNSGLLNWPGMDPRSLRKLASDNLAPGMVINQRRLDVARYGVHSAHPWMPGWRIEMMESSEQPTVATKKRIREATSFVYNCSRDFAYDEARLRDASLVSSFQHFLQLSIDDTMTFDGWAVWTEPSRRGEIAKFAGLPASNIRLANPTRGYKGDSDVFACMLDEAGTPVKPFRRDELFWQVRNPRSEPQAWLYGRCHAADTEVLTKAGWKRFSDVDVDVDEFATMDMSTRAFEWQRASHKTWEPYSGPMYRLVSRCVDQLVTPNHRVVVRMSDESHGYEIVRAGDLFGLKEDGRRRNIKIPTVSLWTGVEIGPKTFTVERAGHHGNGPYPVAMSGDDYCAFFGAYLSEGYVGKGANHRNVYVCQHRQSKGYGPFMDLLERITGSKPYYDGTEIVVCRKPLADHASQFGTDCYSKRIPDEIMAATPRQIRIFLDYFTLGDDCIVNYRSRHVSNRCGRMGGDLWRFSTASRIMADQIQELVQKIGYSAKIHIRQPDFTTFSEVGGRRVYQRNLQYEISVRGSTAHGFEMVEEFYDGMVGCVTVPNGTLYVRRNGKPVWSGNSEIEQAVLLVQGFQGALRLNCTTFQDNAIPPGIMLLMGDYFNQDQIDVFMREWQNMKKGVSKLWGLPVMAVPEKGDVKFVPLNDIRGEEIRYRDHINMMGGLYCVLCGFPPRRLGIFASGGKKDNQPLPDQSVDRQGVDDPGLPPLLNFFAEGITQYLIWPNWPDLKFRFTNADPKNDAREFAMRKEARTWKESRAEADLPPLASLAPKGAEWKKFAEVMEMCPEDPNKASSFQVLASVVLQAELAPEEPTGSDGAGGGSPPSPGNKVTGQKDPAKSEAHGHPAGLRRPSRMEKDRTAANSGGA